MLTQAAKKAPAPIIKLRRNSSNRDSVEEEKIRVDEQTPPRRTQSMGNFIRQEIDEEDLESRNITEGYFCLINSLIDKTTFRKNIEDLREGAAI